MPTAWTQVRVLDLSLNTKMVPGWRKKLLASGVNW
jgi:hypothetical protein